MDNELELVNGETKQHAAEVKFEQTALTQLVPDTAHDTPAGQLVELYDPHDVGVVHDVPLTKHVVGQLVEL